MKHRPMNHTRILLLLIMLLITLGACSRNGDRRYESKRGFSIIPPVGWKPIEAKGQPVTFSGPTADGFRINFNIVGPEVLPQESKNILPGLREALKKNLTNFKLMSTRKLPGKETEAYEMVYTFEMDHKTIKQMLRMVVKENQYASLTYSASPGSFDKYRKAFEASVNTFEIK